MPDDTDDVLETDRPSLGMGGAAIAARRVLEALGPRGSSTEAGDPVPFISRAVRATRESTSLRVTIPQVVAATLGIRPGDDLVWVVHPFTDQVTVEVLHREPAQTGDPVDPVPAA
jgi:hypothetical protein